MIKKVFYSLIFIFFGTEIGNAQQEQSLHFVRDVWQSNFTNPAFVSDSKIQVLLPSFYYNLNSPDFKIQDLLKPNDKGLLSVSDVVKTRLQAQNRVDANIQMQTLGFAFKPYDKWSFSFYHAVNANPSLDLNRDLLKLVVEGNSQYLGKKIDFRSSANGGMYTELGFGMSYNLREHISIGGRVKVLNGIAGLFTTKDKLNIEFDSNNYNLSFDNDFEVKTYSVTTFSSVRSVKDLVRLGFTKNKGFALDLGGTATLGKLNVSISILDLGGSIKWQDDGKSYASKGTFTYSGLNTDNLFKIDSFNAKGFKDTLQKVIGYSETLNPVYSQKIPTKFYLSSTYQITEKFTAGMLIYGETNDINGPKVGMALDGTFTFSEYLSAGANLSLRNGSIANLGIHAVVKLGPVQVYGVTDNIITALQPYNAKMANGRVGINLLF
jgi:Family of unknown function (DUF5723)